MTKPSVPRKTLSRHADRLRTLAKLESLRPHASILLECASDLDQADAELERLKLRCRGLQQDRQVIDLKWLDEIAAHDDRARRDEEAEAASGA